MSDSMRDRQDPLSRIAIDRAIEETRRHADAAADAEGRKQDVDDLNRDRDEQRAAVRKDLGLDPPVKGSLPAGCLTCAFWKPYRADDARKGLGICQRFPPVALKQGTSWPVTGEGDWCGERKDRTLPDFSRGVHEGF